MIAGHFATALIPWSRLRDAPLWVLLLCAQALDFVWFALAALNVEPTEPSNFLDVAVTRLRVDMIYSHSGAGVLVVALLVAAVVYAAFRRAPLAGWCGVLVIGHWLCDLLSGFSHEVTVAGSPRIGLDLYLRSPLLAFAIEAAFSAAVVAWYVRSEARQGRALKRKSVAALVAVFVGGSLFFIPTASTSLRELLAAANITLPN